MTVSVIEAQSVVWAVSMAAETGKHYRVAHVQRAWDRNDAHDIIICTNIILFLILFKLATSKIGSSGDTWHELPYSHRVYRVLCVSFLNHSL